MITPRKTRGKSAKSLKLIASLVVQRSYRRDRWAQQPRRLEVWSEKGTVRGMLAPVLDKYGVTFRVMHGYSSADGPSRVLPVVRQGTPLRHGQVLHQR
jgi:hypothetical protein